VADFKKKGSKNQISNHKYEPLSRTDEQIKGVCINGVFCRL